MRCPCRKKSETQSYDTCCRPFHMGERPAPTPETLMRSRYSAFALGDTAYLLATWHPSTRPAHLELDPGREWLLLRIVKAGADGDSGTVSFTARSRLAGRTDILEETSRFLREDGRWRYVDGIIGD